MKTSNYIAIACFSILINVTHYVADLAENAMEHSIFGSIFYFILAICWFKLFLEFYGFYKYVKFKEDQKDN